MSECSEDLKDLIVYASALLINIGTLTPEKVGYYKEAIKLAKEYDVSIILLILWAVMQELTDCRWS